MQTPFDSVEDKVKFETSHAYLTVFSFVLLAAAISFVAFMVKDTVRDRPRPPLRWIWLGFIVACFGFSYLVISLPPKGYYADLLGPAWITQPIMLTVDQLALPLAVLVAGSVLEGTNHRIVTKLNALILLYAYGAFCVSWQIPSYLQSLDTFRYIGPLYHTLLIAASFLLEYAIIRYWRRRA